MLLKSCAPWDRALFTVLWYVKFRVLFFDHTRAHATHTALQRGFGSKTLGMPKKTNVKKNV